MNELKLAENELCAHISTKGIRLRLAAPINDRPAKPQNGVLALTCDTLLSSQGAGAHLREAFDLVLGQRSKLTEIL
jgi:hypothetical protein